MPRAILWDLFDLPEADSALAKWIDEKYIPGIMQSSGSGHAIRYRAYDGVSPAHAVFYDAPSVSSVSFSAEVFTSPEDQAMLAKLGNHVERSMEQLFDSGSCPEPPKYVAAAYIEPAAGGIEEFHAWYNEEHLDHVKDIPAWQRSQRFELAKSTTPNEPTQLAQYEFTDKPDFDSDVIKRNLGNPRSVRNMSSAQSVVIRKYETVKTFP